MKKFIFVLLLFAVSSLFASFIDSQDIHEIKGKKKNIIYDAIINHVSSNYSTTAEMEKSLSMNIGAAFFGVNAAQGGKQFINIDLSDKEGGKIVLTVVDSFQFAMYDRFFRYKKIIDIRDNRIRVSNTNYEPLTIRGVAGYADGDGMHAMPDSAKQAVKDAIEKFELNFVKAINESKQDEW